MAMGDQGKRSPRKDRLTGRPVTGRPATGAPASPADHAAGGPVPVYDEENRPLNRAARRAAKRSKP